MRKEVVFALIAMAVVASFLSHTSKAAMATCLQTYSADTCNYTLR